MEVNDCPPHHVPVGGYTALAGSREPCKKPIAIIKPYSKQRHICLKASLESNLKDSKKTHNKGEEAISWNSSLSVAGYSVDHIQAKGSYSSDFIKQLRRFIFLISLRFDQRI